MVCSRCWDWISPKLVQDNLWQSVRKIWYKDHHGVSLESYSFTEEECEVGNYVHSDTPTYIWKELLNFINNTNMVCVINDILPSLRYYHLEIWIYLFNIPCSLQPDLSLYCAPSWYLREVVDDIFFGVVFNEHHKLK